MTLSARFAILTCWHGNTAFDHVSTFEVFKTFHCVKSVRIWRFSGPLFSRIRTEYGEILRIYSYSVQIRENTDQKNSEYKHFLRSFQHLLKYYRGRTTLLIFLLFTFMLNPFSINVVILYPLLHVFEHMFFFVSETSNTSFSDMHVVLLQLKHELVYS